MADAARPSDDEFSQVLQESLITWTSYLGSESEGDLFPRHAVDLKSLIVRTPPFLGDGFVSSEEMSFSCEEKPSSHGIGSLVINGQSTWRTSEGTCTLQPRVLRKQLLLAGSSRLSVRLSEHSPFSSWPGVQGLSDYDRGNYISVLYFAWAYILSARWVEALSRSADHDCHMGYNVQAANNSSPTNEQSTIQIDIGEDACVEEVFWWRTVLFSNDGWNASTKYNGHVYLSPWSLSAKHTGLTVTNALKGAEPKPPSSLTALSYLSRFCTHHGLYAQCSVALAGVLYIPLLPRRTLFLPVPKQTRRQERELVLENGSVSIAELINDLSELLPRYMTLSSNTWGLRSLLCSTFFNPDIDCNLVSAWLNPAFAVIDSIASRKSAVAVLLANRQPRLGILWLGASLVDLATPILRDIRTGMMALDLPASAWTGTIQTFLTLRMGNNHCESIRRDDECRLLFITASEGHERPPVWPWKPFGFTKLCDTELPVQQHAQCAAHCLEYEYWEWILTKNNSLRDSGTELTLPHIKASDYQVNRPLARLDDFNFDFYSQSLSEGTTRGIFEWLRSTGYPRNERPIYEHSWFDLEGSDDEEVCDDLESDLEEQESPKRKQVESWLESIG